ncbi:MAG TPA: TonB family protein [Pyrinomonadaceae bacterium]|jgi:protein TonB
MFTNLIESESHREDFKRRGSFLLVTTAVYALFFVFAGVLSIYAYDAQLEKQDQDLMLLEWVPPVTTPTNVVSNPHSPSRSARHNTGPARPARLPVLYESSANPHTVPTGVSAQPVSIPPAPPGAIRSPVYDPGSSGPATAGPIGPGNNGTGGRVSIVPNDGDVVPPPIKQPPRTIHKSLLNSQAISLPKPPYPPMAKLVHAQGTVSVQVLLDETGKVISARAVGGHPTLTHAAVEAAYQARFTPTVLNGTPVKVSGVITYNFILQ